MSNVARITWLTAGIATLGAANALAGGQFGFADVPGGGKKDPIIEIAASIGPNQGAVFSLTEDQANDLYRFKSDANPPSFLLSTPVPTIPQTANGANEFIRMKFPMKLTKKLTKTILKNTASLQPTSFLTPKLTFTDETGAHVHGIAVVNGKEVDGTNVGGHPQFPLWLDTKGKNLLIGDNILTYVADDGDGDLATIAAFGPISGNEQTSSIKEVRIRLDEIGGITVNGFWVVKMGTGQGVPVSPQTPLTITAVEAQLPVKPIKFVNGNQVVESSSSYVVRYTEPVVPLSVGFNVDWVKSFNADNPVFPIFFLGNTFPVPNFDLTALAVPIYPTFEVRASPTGVTNFRVPYNVRPINPNNLSEYLVNPIIEVPAKVDMTLRGLALANNSNQTAVGTVSTAVTSLYNNQFNDASTAASKAFHTNTGRAFVNVPVSPSVLYYAPVSGTGIGLINLDGNGYETNDPATSRILVMTNNLQMCACGYGVIGPTAYGCNPNTFGDPNGANPIGLAGNPQGTLGGPTPIPGVNEGSQGSTANVGVGGGIPNPNGIYPAGFETVARTSDGNPRLNGTPLMGSVGDIAVGDFLDKIYYDTQNPSSFANGLHTSLETATSLGGSFLLTGNSIADPPVPNPPPLRLPVGLPPVDIVFNQQKLLKPAFVMEGDEVWSAWAGCAPTTDPLARIALIPQTQYPFQGDSFPTFVMNGPAWQTFTVAFSAYSSRQQIGNFLYVTDRDQGVIHVLNSNNFSILDDIKTPDPEALTFAPDMSRMYVANFGDDSMSIVDTNPVSPSFHKEINRVNVDGGPIAISSQPEHEDVFVCNYVGNSVSIFDPTTNTVRKTITSTINKPFDVLLDPRHLLTGFQSFVYFGYIGNQGTGMITIYESGASDVGLDDVRWSVTSTDTSISQFPQMRGLLYDMGTFPGSTFPMPGGVYISHRDPQTGLPMVSRIANTEQKPAVGPLPPLPPPNSVLGIPGTYKRTFEIVGQWGGPLQPLGQLNLNGQDLIPYDLAFGDINTKDFFGKGLSIMNGFTRTNVGHLFPQAGGGQWNSKSPIRLLPPAPTPVPVVLADRLYISFAGDNRIEVVDPQNSGVILNRIEGVPLPGKLVGFFDL